MRRKETIAARNCSRDVTGKNSLPGFPRKVTISETHTDLGGNMSESHRVRCRGLIAALYKVSLLLGIGSFVICVLNFPYSYDQPLNQAEVEEAKKHFEKVYKPAADVVVQASEPFRGPDEDEIRITKNVRKFAEEYNLLDKAVLDIGSGGGYLQDVVENYTGLDIAASAAPLYHKKFVVGSATAMPFPDNNFDAAWSIWAFEHIPNPEQALAETRRVVRPGGILLLMPAWNVPPWFAQGYPVRPYSDLDLQSRLIKASIPLRESFLYGAILQLPVRISRHVASLFGPTRLRYTALDANFDKRWMHDSDAVNSIDSHEMILWFISRGDDCLNCDGPHVFFPLGGQPLIIRVNKGGSAR